MTTPISPTAFNSRSLQALLTHVCKSNHRIEHLGKEVRQAILSQNGKESFLEYAQAHPNLINASPLLSKVCKKLSRVLTEATTRSGTIRRILNSVAKKFSTYPEKQLLLFERELFKTAEYGLAISNAYQDNTLECNKRVGLIKAYMEDSVIKGTQDLVEPLKVLADKKWNVPGNAIATKQEQDALVGMTLAINAIALQCLKHLPRNPAILKSHARRVAQLNSFNDGNRARSIQVTIPVMLLIAKEDRPLFYRITFGKFIGESRLYALLTYLMAKDKPLLKELLTATNDASKPFLHKPRVYASVEKTLSLLADSDPEMLLDVLGTQSAQGKTLLHENVFDNVKMSRIFLYRTPQKLIENIPFNTSEVLSLKLLELYSKQDLEGKTCLHQPMVDDLIKVLNTLHYNEPTVEILCRLLRIQAHGALPLVQYGKGEFTRLALTTWKNHPAILYTLYSLQATDGSTMLHMFSRAVESNKAVTALAEARLLDQIDVDLACDLLSIQNRAGKTPLQHAKELKTIGYYLIWAVDKFDSVESRASLIELFKQKGLERYRQLLLDSKNKEELILALLKSTNWTYISYIDPTGIDRARLAESLISGFLLAPQAKISETKQLDIAKFVLETPNLNVYESKFSQFLVKLLRDEAALRLLPGTPSILNNLREGIKTLLLSDISFVTAHRHTGTIAKFRIFEKDDPFYRVLAAIQHDSILDRHNTFWTYQGFKKELTRPLDFEPELRCIEGAWVSLSLKNLQQMSKQFTVARGLIPATATVHNWTTVRDSLRNKITGSRHLTNKYSNFNDLWDRSLKDPFFIDCLTIHPSAQSVELHKAQFAAILNWIMSFPHDTSPLSNQELTPREDLVLKLGYAFIDCPTGKRQNIAAFYNTLPAEFKLPLYSLEFDGSEQRMRAKQEMFQFIRKTILDTIADPRLSIKLSDNRNTSQHVHQIEFIQNSIGHLVGLGDTIIYDPHIGVLPRKMLTLSKKEVLVQFLQFFTPQMLVKKFQEASKDEPLEKKSGEDTFNDLVASLITSSAVFWDYDEEGIHRTLTKRGAMELLRALGILKIDGFNIIHDWKISFNFLEKKSAEELQIIYKWNKEKSIKENVDNLYLALLTDFKDKSVTEKHQLLFKWMERHLVLKQELLAHVSESGKEEFERRWYAIVKDNVTGYKQLTETLIKALLQKVHAFSIVTLLEQKQFIVDKLIPFAKGFDELKSDLKKGIDHLAFDALKQELLHGYSCEVLDNKEALEFSFGTDTKREFDALLKSSAFAQSRWDCFKELLDDFLYEVDELGFDLEILKRFCHHGIRLVPEGGFSGVEDCLETFANLDKMMAIVMGSSTPKNRYRLKSAKAIFDPLLIKLGLPELSLD